MRLLFAPKTKRLLRSIAERPGSSYLLTGKELIGKASAAKEIARQLNDDPAATLVVTPEKNTIGIAQIAELTRQLKLKSADAQSQRTVIIEDADCMTFEAQNSFLKTVEEPPVNTTILMTSAHRGRILPTILSRCQIIVCHPPQSTRLKTVLRDQYGLDEEKASAIVKLSRGAPALAIRLARDDKFYESLELELQMAADLLESSLYNRLLLSGQLMAKDSHLDASRVVSFLIDQVREQLQAGEADSFKPLLALASYIHNSQSNANQKLAFDRLMIELG